MCNFCELPIKYLTFQLEHTYTNFPQKRTVAVISAK